jgi:hypothetical protein
MQKLHELTVLQNQTAVNFYATVCVAIFIVLFSNLHLKQIGRRLWTFFGFHEELNAN